MNPTNTERTRDEYLSAWGMDRATDSTSVTLGLSTDTTETTRNTSLRRQELHVAVEAYRMDPDKVPKAQSYGGVLFSADGQFLLREPIDQLTGYVWTWPKGKPEKGETPAQTALREVHEETGYRARIIGVLPKVYRGTMRTTAFFLMEPVGEQGSIINETVQTRWVSYEEACKLINLNKHAVGRNRDRAILDDAVHYGIAPISGRIPVSVWPIVGDLSGKQTLVDFLVAQQPNFR